MSKLIKFAKNTYIDPAEIAAVDLVESEVRIFLKGSDITYIGISENETSLLQVINIIECFENPYQMPLPSTL